MSKKINMIGKKFNRLTVVCEYGRDKQGRCRYLCRCDCGNEKVIFGGHLRSGRIKSCGCYAREVASAVNTKYAKEDKILYTTWIGMRQRCNNKNVKLYYRYGGRGISICEEWDDYLKFFHWAIENGYEKGKQLDRINNDGNYEPLNCRWVTRTENNNNKSNVKQYEIKGITHTLTEWCQINNVRRNTVKARLSRGWDIEKALFTPLLNGQRQIIGELPAFE